MQWGLISLVKSFKTPKKTLGNLDAEAAGTLIAAAADVTLIIDGKGIIRDFAFQNQELSTALDQGLNWLGQRWADTVTTESRPKIESLLSQSSTKAPTRWRQVNHPSAGELDVPVMYSAVQVGDEKRIVAFGRDLRVVSALQQRLVNAQQSMEADYSRLQYGEMRYRVMFQLSSEAVLIVDAASLKVVESNPAADRLFEQDAGRLAGQAFPGMFDDRSGPFVQSLLGSVRVAGRADDVRATLAAGRGEFIVSASLFRQENTAFFLVRLSRAHQETIAAILPKAKSKLLKVVENAPDGFVVTGQDGLITTANAAFLEMAELATEEMAVGQSLERWFGRPGVDLDVMIANLRQRGSMRLFATTLRGEFSAMSEVEISAVSVMNGGHPCYGFAIRNVGRRLPPETRAGRELPRSVGQLTELIGRVALKDLVRESTDMIERLCIEAALELTGDNRASAAEMLGLSRQSLYVKLRRYGLGDLATEAHE